MASQLRPDVTGTLSGLSIVLPHRTIISQFINLPIFWTDPFDSFQISHTDYNQRQGIENGYTCFRKFHCDWVILRVIKLTITIRSRALTLQRNSTQVTLQSAMCIFHGMRSRHSNLLDICNVCPTFCSNPIAVMEVIIPKSDPGPLLLTWMNLHHK